MAETCPEPSTLGAGRRGDADFLDATSDRSGDTQGSAGNAFMVSSTRRAALAGLICACCSRPGRAVAQRFAMLCDFAGFGFGGMPPIIGPGTPLALRQVAAIQQAIGYDAPLLVVQAGGGNAFAMRDPQSGRPVIGYNPQFLFQLLQLGGEAAPTSVLAHEVGHHANGDTTWRGIEQHPWQRELGADFVSGLALARLGASPEEATRALRAMFNLGSPSHPDTPRRVQAVLSGWQQGNGRGRLGFG
jgi:hypothetical protein